MRSCALAASFNGKTESTTGFNLPFSKNCSTSCSSANPPMYDPNNENCRVNTYRISTYAFPQLVTPQFTNRPPGAKHRILRYHVAVPTCSNTTTTFSPTVNGITSAGTSTLVC